MSGFLMSCPTCPVGFQPPTLTDGVTIDLGLTALTVLTTSNGKHAVALCPSCADVIVAGGTQVSTT